MISTSSLGGWLKQRRQALDLSQHALAAQIGCAGDPLRKIEAGRRHPARQIAELLAADLIIPRPEHAALVA